MRSWLTTIGAALLVLGAALACGGRDNHSSQLIPTPQEPAAAPMTEDVLIAEFRRLFPDAEKRPAELMNPEKTVVEDLVAELITEDAEGQPLDPPLVRLTFSATNYADYNNDTVVDIKDITPLAARFNLSYEDSPLPEEILSPRLIDGHPDTLFNRQIAAADGNGDGAINISDLTPIAANFNNELAGYNIYRAQVIDSLLTWSEVPLANLLGGASTLSVSIGEWTDEQEATTGHGASAQGRLFFELTTEAPPEGETYGYRACAFGHGEEGPHGNAATVSRPSTEDTTPPYWVDEAGISGTRALDEGVEVTWGTAVDAKSPPVHYRIYYSPGIELDWGSATAIDDVSSPYEIYALTTLEPYTFAVRAYDSSANVNEEANMVTLTEYPGPRDSYPPEWQTAVGITNAVGTEDGFIVTWELAKDYYDDGTAIWQSDPVRYRIYWSRTSPIDFATGDFIEVDPPAPEQPWQWYEFVGGFDHETRYYFAVRAIDSAQPTRNEDENAVTLYAFIPEWSWTEVYRTVEGPDEGYLVMSAPYLLLGESKEYLIWDEDDKEPPAGGPGVFKVKFFEFEGEQSALHTAMEFDAGGTGGRSGNLLSAEAVGDDLLMLIELTTGLFKVDLKVLRWDGERIQETTIPQESEESPYGATLVLLKDELLGVSYSRPDDSWNPTKYERLIRYASEDYQVEHILYTISADEVDFAPFDVQRMTQEIVSVSPDLLLGLDAPPPWEYVVVTPSGFEWKNDAWFRAYGLRGDVHFLGGEEGLPLLFFGNHEIINEYTTEEYGLYEWNADEPVPYSVDQHPLWLRDDYSDIESPFIGDMAYTSAYRKPLAVYQEIPSRFIDERDVYFVATHVGSQMLKFRLPVPLFLDGRGPTRPQFWRDEENHMRILLKAREKVGDNYDFVTIQYDPIDVGI